MEIGAIDRLREEPRASPPPVHSATTLAATSAVSATTLGGGARAKLRILLLRARFSFVERHDRARRLDAVHHRHLEVHEDEVERSPASASEYARTA